MPLAATFLPGRALGIGVPRPRGAFKVRSVAAPLIGAIVHTYEPENVAQYDLYNIVKPATLLQGVLEEYPSVNDPFNAMPSGYLPDFNYYLGLFDGPTLEFLYDSGLAMNVWETGFKHIMAVPPFPYVTDPAGIFHVDRSTWRGPLYFTSTKWIRRLVGADVANAMGYDGSGVTVVVTDTGGTRANPMTVRMGKMTAVDANLYDAIGHGEHTASTIGGARAISREFTELNGKPVEMEGMAPGCTLIEIKALDYVIGTGTDAQLIKSLQDAIKVGADIVNASWGGPETAKSPEEDPFYIPVKTMVEKYNILFVASSGDSGPGPSPSSPAAMPQAISVGSINAVGNDNPAFGPAGMVSGFSGRGPVPWGGQIYPYTTNYGAIFASAITGWLRGAYTGVVGNYQALAGTSMSAPVTSGLLAIMRQAHMTLLNRTLTLNDVMDILKVAQDYWGIDDPNNNEYGYGPLTFDIYLKYLEDKYGLSMAPASGAGKA